MAKLRPDANFLGLEIRRPVVEFAESRRLAQGLTNAHILACNARVDMPRLMTDLANKQIPVHQISVHFPDPYFKKRHKKRRTVTDDLVQSILAGLRAGGSRPLIILQSDVFEVLLDMASCFVRSKGFRPAQGQIFGHENQSELFSANPSLSPVRTEREVATEVCVRFIGWESSFKWS